MKFEGLFLFAFRLSEMHPSMVFTKPFYLKGLRSGECPFKEITHFA